MNGSSINQPVEQNPNVPKKVNFNPKLLLAGIISLFIVIVIFTLNYLNTLPLSKQYPKLFGFLPHQQSIGQTPSGPQNPFALSVNGDKISQDELDQTIGLFSYLKSKEATDAAIKKEALDFTIEWRLLKKEAQRRGIDVGSTVEEKFQSSLLAYNGETGLTNTYKTSVSVFKNYLLDQTLRQTLEPQVTKWAVVDYLSIRYLWGFDAKPEELTYKKPAERKIQEYFTKIQDGLDIKEAIKQRCNDPELNSSPYNEAIYSKSFDGKICREQRTGLKVSQDTNPEWGETWLQDIFKIPKGQTQIITLEKPGVGLYFIVKVLETNQDGSFSLTEFINNLKNNARITIYEH